MSEYGRNYFIAHMRSEEKKGRLMKKTLTKSVGA